MFQRPRAHRIRVLAAAGAAVLSISLLASPALAATTTPGPVADDQPRVISIPHPLTPATTSPAGTATDVPTSDTTTSAPTTAPPLPPGPEIPTITWTPCRGAFQCARTTAPLDYDRPFATTISLALIRLPAADPAQRIGSLFVNPGGPGGSGVDFVRQAGRSLPLELRGRFDIIGFDPRGVAESTPLRCFATLQEAVAVLPPFAFPVTDEEQAQGRTGDLALSAACADRGGAIQNHMSTANVARDLDLLRQAVGDDKLNFLGYSYGSYIGATYANLFPDRVGALVVDGVLDPVAWSTGTDDESATLPFTSRLGSDAGASSTLGEFFRLCDAAGTNCALAPNAEVRFSALTQDALDGGIQVVDEFGTFTLTYSDLIGFTLGVMYAPEAWPDFAQALAGLEPASAGGARQRLDKLASTLGARTAVQEQYPNFVESFAGVACGETDNPLQYQAWPTAAAAADQRTGYFGRLWTWASSICQPWPGQDADRYAGPWTAATVNPVLVVGNSFDPVTPYPGAQRVAELLPNSSLLTYTGWGHTAFGSGNFCVDSTVVAYLITRQAPPTGTVCEADGSPFGPLAAARGLQADQSAPSIRAALIPDIIRRAVADAGS